MTGDLLNTAPCGFVSFGDDGKVTLVNDTLLEILGYDRADVVGRHLERILTVGSRIFYQTHWFPLLRYHGRSDEIFLLLRARDGSDVGVLVNARRAERDGRACYDCILLRVRERQRYEDELLRARREADRLRAAADEANQAKSRFLAVMSHELRTPLNAILGYVQLLDMGIHGPVTDQQRDTLARIGRSQSHLLTLIDDILDLSRIEAGRVEFRIEAFPLIDVARAVAPMLHPQLKAKGLDFQVRIPDDLAVRADPEKLRQILLNLLGNAVKFTGDGGRVSLLAERDPDDGARARIRVRDTGIGIPADQLEAIFDPFVQLKDDGGGTHAHSSGLGLAISRDLARGMDGDLNAASAPGDGSTFTLTLPVASPSAPGPP